MREQPYKDEIPQKKRYIPHGSLKKRGRGGACETQANRFKIFRGKNLCFVKAFDAKNVTVRISG